MPKMRRVKVIVFYFFFGLFSLLIAGCSGDANHQVEQLNQKVEQLQSDMRELNARTHQMQHDEGRLKELVHAIAQVSSAQQQLSAAQEQHRLALGEQLEKQARLNENLQARVGELQEQLEVRNAQNVAASELEQVHKLREELRKIARAGAERRAEDASRSEVKTWLSENHHRLFLAANGQLIPFTEENIRSEGFENSTGIWMRSVPGHPFQKLGDFMYDHHIWRRIRDSEGLIPKIPTYFYTQWVLKYMEELDPLVEKGDKAELESAISRLGIPDNI